VATHREQLEKAVSDLKAFGAELDAKSDGPSAEDIERVNTLAADVLARKEALLAIAKVNGTLDMSKAFLADLSGAPTPTDAAEQRAADTGIVNPKGLTLGEAVAKSPAYSDFLSRFKSSDGSIAKEVTVGRQQLAEAGVLYGKGLITGLSDTSAGAFVTTQRLPVVSDLVGERRLYVRDLCTNIQIPGKDTFDYVTVTTKTNAAAPVLEATTSATPGLNNVAVGAYTAAHGVKPEANLVFAVVTSIVETIAHIIPVTRRAAADGGQVMQLINEFMLYGLREEEEDQILNGNGTTPNLRGILQTVGINTVGSAGTDLDAIVDGIAAIRADNREPNAMVIHPNDWFSTGFLLAKDTAGNYLVGDPRASLDQLNSLWGLRVVVTPAMTENTVLVGDFRQAVVADSMQGTIYMTDSHNDHFARNILDILAEERLGFGVLDPEAFATVTAV
jgi:HK97 family phage major capsid protein